VSPRLPSRRSKAKDAEPEQAKAPAKAKQKAAEDEPTAAASAADESSSPARTRSRKAKADDTGAKAAGAKAADDKAADARKAGAESEAKAAADAKAAPEAKAAADDEPADEDKATQQKPKPRARRAASAKAAPESKGAGRKREQAEPGAKKPSSEAPARRRGARGQRASAAHDGELQRVLVSARARYVRTSPRKARMVCGHLRGLSVHEARAILAFTPRGAAREWSKLLESAVANAEHNHELLEDDLVVREAYADVGPTIKRYRPRALGRATSIYKRTSHLTITLAARR
jgi:ribosomal protein L22